MRLKQYPAEIKASDAGFTAVITSDVVDRDKEVLLPEGMDSKDFMTSPTVFWNHDYSQPVARALKLRRAGRTWEADVKMATRPETHEGEWFPDTIHALMKQGIVNGVSVGFDPLEYRDPTSKDVSTFGDECKRVISKWRLFEFSITPLPANQEALVSQVSKGLIPQWVLGTSEPNVPRGTDETSEKATESNVSPVVLFEHNEAPLPARSIPSILIVDLAKDFPWIRPERTAQPGIKELIRDEVARRTGRVY